jgi:hypothetical protein
MERVSGATPDLLPYLLYFRAITVVRCLTFDNPHARRATSDYLSILLTCGSWHKIMSAWRVFVPRPLRAGRCRAQLTTQHNLTVHATP